MGAGVAYPYEYFMLVDFEDEDDYDDLVRFLHTYAPHDIAQKDESRWLMSSRHAWCILSMPRMNVGIDSSGGTSCIVCEPKTYWRKGWHEEKAYNIRRDVYDLFNKLIKNTCLSYSKATSAWTSRPLTRYP